MRGFLPLLCALCAARARGVLDGTCPRKDSPPGVLVVPPGSALLLTCTGRVEVDGVKVRVHENSSNSRRGTPPSAHVTATAAVRTTRGKRAVEEAAGEEQRPNPPAGLGLTGTQRAPCATAHAARPTGPSTPLQGARAREAKGTTGGAGDEEEEEEEEAGEEGGRVTGSLKSRLRWRWNGRTVGKEDTGRRAIALDRGGESLSLSSVGRTDSGRYACYHRGRERFSLSVHVADPPENPSLVCHKTSPSSKIRCEWAPEKPVAMSPTCYLLLSKSPSNVFHRLPCSYSPRRSRCSCTLDHNEDERRTVHVAYLCVTSVAGNATSDALSFIPLGLLKPEAPSGVTVRQEEGPQMRMTVAWSLPKSWKSQDSYYELVYEIKYRPVKSTMSEGQRQTLKQRSYTIVDAMPGVEYLIQLRTSEEYDGQWSDWSPPVHASSRLWTAAPVESSEELLSAPTFPVYPDVEGSSGTDDGGIVDPEPVQSGTEVLHVMWISGSLFLLLVIFVAYILRHKDRFMPKLWSQRLVVTQCAASARPPTPTPTPPEGPAQVTFDPPCYHQTPQSDVEGEEQGESEEHPLRESAEAVHLNNKSYFLLPRDC
ncbi:interleukin-6 receptor subunit alpha [Spinachia spinachia]